MDLAPREFDPEKVYVFVNPYRELNLGLWLLFSSASIFLFLRVWVKINYRHGLWYDDWILIISWAVLLANNSLIVHEYRTGYVLPTSVDRWDDRMHILINITSCGTLIGQALTKTAFGVTLMRISSRWQQAILWFCIATMNIWMLLKVIFQWAKVCDQSNYQDWFRLDICIYWKFRDDFKEGGNVYNIIMDFVFATFPWLILHKLEMRRMEKIGICFIMSLGIIVAIVSAIRVAWKDKGNPRDEWHIWRSATSQVWYSSEITGTILVQCIPILRTVLQDIHSSLGSKKLGSSTDGGGRASSMLPDILSPRKLSSSAMGYHEVIKSDGARIELGAIGENPAANKSWIEFRSSEEATPHHQIQDCPRQRDLGPDASKSNPWLHSNDGRLSTPRSNTRHGKTSQGSTRENSLDEPCWDQGLSPPPPRGSYGQARPSYTGRSHI